MVDQRRFFLGSELGVVAKDGVVGLGAVVPAKDADFRFLLLGGVGVRRGFGQRIEHQAVVVGGDVDRARERGEHPVRLELPLRPAAAAGAEGRDDLVELGVASEQGRAVRLGGELVAEPPLELRV